MSYDPTQPVPPPINPTQLESLPASPPPEGAAPPSDMSSNFAETQLAPPPPPPGGYVEPPPPTPRFSLRKDWPIAALALLYAVSLIVLFIQSPSSSAAEVQPSAAETIISTIAVWVMIGVLVGVLILDARGYFSLRGWVRRRRNQSDRLILGCIWVFFFIIFLPIYFVRRFMGKPREALPLPEIPYGGLLMPAPMMTSDPYSGPLSGPIGGPMSGPMPPYMSGPVSAPPSGYVPSQPSMPVYMNQSGPPPTPPQVIIVQNAPPPAQLIRTYKGGWHSAQRAFQKDAIKLAREGWRVHQVVTTQSASAGLYMGMGVGVANSKAKELTVIYQR